MIALSRPLPRTSPAAVGVDPAALRRLIDALDARGETHSLMVLRHGQIVAEQWWDPAAPETRTAMYSVSKTFTSMGVGLAVADGLLTVEDRVVDLLAEHVPSNPSPNLLGMRVKHLLTMTPGHDNDPVEDIRPGSGVEDWVGAILAAPVALEPGTRFQYDSSASYLLSAIVQKVTGQRLLDWLTPRVLEPLGIEGATWEQCPRGIDLGAFGLALTTEDMAAFGQLLLQGGRWGDAQLIPAAWIEDAMTRRSDPSVMGWGRESQIGYGYQMWENSNGSWRADGAFGQFIVVWPEHDVVVATTSASQENLDVLGVLWKELDGAFGEAAAPSAGTTAPEPSRRTLQVPVVDGAAWMPVGDLVEGRTFAVARAPGDELLDGVPRGIPAAPAAPSTLTVTREGDLVVLDDGRTRAVAALGRWNHGDETFTDTLGGALRLASSYAWTGERTLEVCAAAVGTPFMWTTVLTFAEDGQTADVVVRQNVAFTERELLRTTARAV
jgi:CubicO group peptidase (beta-lactamase class C family)